MIRHNKFIIIFFSMMTFSMYVLWLFIQSERFGDFLSRNITKYTEAKYKINLSFENARVEFFPPGLLLNNVVADTQDYNLNISQLGVYFSVIDLFSNRVSIQDIILKDGVVDIYNLVNKNSEENTENKFKISDISYYINIALDNMAGLPVNIKNISFKDISLIAVDKLPLEIIDLSTRLKNNSITLNFIIQNISLALLGIDETVDELSFRGQITSKQINVVELAILDDTDLVKLEGNVLNDNLSYLGKVQLNSKLERLSPLFLKAINKKIDAGRSLVECEIQGEFTTFATICNVEMTNFILPLVYGEKLKANINVTNEFVKINTMEMNDKEQFAKIIKPFTLLKYSQIKNWPLEPIRLYVKNYELNNALFVAKDIFKPVNGQYTGEITLSKVPKGLKFDIHNGGIITNLNVNFGGKTDFVNIKKINANSSEFIVGPEIDVKMNLFINETKLNIDAKVNDDEVKITSKNGFINFEELGPIAGFKIKGKGIGDVVADAKQQHINIKSKIDEFSFEGFELDEVSGIMDVFVADGKIQLSEIKGRSHQSTIQANIDVNTKTTEINGFVNHERLNFLGASKIYAPIISKMEIPFEVIGDWKTSYKISGLTSIDGVIIDGKFFGKNNYIMNENIESILFDFEFKDKVLVANNIAGKKGLGTFTGGARVDLNKNKNILTLNPKNIPLSEIKMLTKSPIAVDGKLDGTFTMEKGAEIKYIADLDITNTTHGETKFGDSKITLNHNNNKSSLDLSMLGDQIIIKGVIDWREDNKSSSKDSKIEAAINISNLNEMLGVFAFIDPNLTGVTSSIHMDIISDFNVNNSSYLDLDVLINEFILKKRKLELVVRDQNESQIVVENGLIKKWDINFKGDGIFLISHARGDFLNDYYVKTRIKFGAPLLEVASNYISRSEGSVVAYFESTSNHGVKNSQVSIVSEDLAISSEKFPTAITKASMKLSLNDKRLFVEKFDANLIAGNLKIVGDLDFNYASPVVNLKYHLTDAGISMFKKTNFVVSGSGSVIGRSMPYSLGGDLQISRLLVANEFTDFLGQNAIQLADIKFLPTEKKSLSEKYLNLKLTVTNNGPYMISNSMAQLGMQGILNISGDERDYRLAGKLELAALDNKIRFKNNEYNLTTANFYFSDQKKYTMPDFEIKANSKISNYKINIATVGNPKNYRVDMVSEPTLGRESIFSLIAFGYTDDLQSKLTDDEKNSMRTAGVGALLFDRFKINETLKKEFGLQVNVGTEIAKNNQTSINAQTANQAVGQVRSATTIEVKKQIAKDVKMSVMSTVGGTSGQRQSMNLNYNVNDVISVEGIYEKKTNINQEQVIDGTSVGADLKMKWTFK